MSEKVLMCWSSGKDSALALHDILKGGEHEVATLLSTISEDYDRVSMHGVRSCLVERQAACLGIPLEKVLVPTDCTNDQYEAAMVEMLTKQQAAGVSAVVFGDIFLEGIREYRKNNVGKAGMTALFPLWGQDSAELARRCIGLGFRAIITCVDSQQLDAEFLGRQYDEQFLADLPKGVDLCGENGEFHSFVYDGPIFSEPIACETGEVVVRHEHFHFCDVLSES